MRLPIFDMKTALYVSTTLITTFIHSLCCLLPLLTAFVGFGGMGSLNWLLQYQAYIVGFQVILMAWSFYQVYVKHQSASVAHVRREKVLLWGIAVFSIIAAVLPHSSWLRSEKQQLTAEQIQRVMSTRKISLEVTAPSASSDDVMAAAADLNGVVASQVTYQHRVLTLRYHLKETTKEAIVQQLRAQGFRVVERSSLLASR